MAVILQWSLISLSLCHLDLERSYQNLVIHILLVHIIYYNLFWIFNIYFKSFTITFHINIDKKKKMIAILQLIGVEDLSIVPYVN